MALAGWVQDGGSLNLNANHDVSYAYLAAIGATPYVAWAESDGAVVQIYVKHYQGGSWIQDGTSLNVLANEDARSPSMADLGGNPIVAFREDVAGYSLIYAKHFNGSDWVLDGGTLNINVNQFAYNANIAKPGGSPYVAWNEYNGDHHQIFVKHFNGSDWVQDGGVVNADPSQQAVWARLAFANSTPYVAGQQQNAPLQYIFVKHYNGSAWIQDGGGLNVNMSQNAMRPSLAMSGTTPYAAWFETTASFEQIYVKHYNGSAWEQDGGSLNVNTNQNAEYPCLAISSTTPYVAWYESDGMFNQIYVKHYNGNSWERDGGSLNVNANQTAYYPILAICNLTPYVAWYESNGSIHQAYVKHYVAAGNATFTPTPMAAGPGLLPGSFSIRHARIRPTRGENAQFVFSFSAATRTRLTVYDLLGQRVATLVDETLAAGSHQFIWNGGTAGSGTYVVYFEASGKQARGKVVVIR